MRCSSAVLLFWALCCASAAASWHVLRRPAVPVQSFDRKVLGKLPNNTWINRPRTPRSHSFVTSLAVGTPPQVMQCLLDTGFADLWVGSWCKSCKRHGFASGSSETFAPAFVHDDGRRIWDPVEVPANGKKLLGYLARDTVAFGAGTFRNQSLLVVEGAELSRKRDWDAICGLGRYQVATAGQPLYGRIADASHGGQTVFAFVPRPNQQPFFLAGEIPYTACKEGTLSWAKTEPMRRGGRSHFWAISGGLAIRKNTPMPVKFLVDTGTAFLLAPPAKYFGFVRSLFPTKVFDRLCGMDSAADGLVVCDCAITRAEGTVPLRLFVGEQPFTLEIVDLFKRVPTTTGSELCLLQVQSNPRSSVDPLDLVGDLLGTGATSSESSAAQTSEEPSFHQRSGRVWIPKARLEGSGVDSVPVLGPTKEDLDNNLWVLGSVFLEKFVTVLDFENSRVGVAEAADEIVMPSYLRRGLDLHASSADSPAVTASPPTELPPLAAAKGEVWQPAGVKALRAGAMPPHDMPRVMADAQSMAGPVAPSAHAVGSPDHQPRFPWASVLLCAGVAAGAAGSAWLHKKLSTRKNTILDPLDPPMPEVAMEEPVAE